MEQTHAIPAAPATRGRPRKSAPVATPTQFPGKVIRLKSRPRLAVGDLVELCRGCLPSNLGKQASIEAFKDDGRVLVRSLLLPFDTFDPDTRTPTGQSMTAALSPENLYRLDKSCRANILRRVK